MDKYKAAGAHYFVALASHHDNFDNFNSTYNPWNAVRVGSHKDILGLWRDAALHDDLRFGVSWHADQRGWDYNATSYGADATGPFAGVPYDGHDPANAALYNPVHVAKTRPSQDWLERWTKRQTELIDRYHSDRLYYDGGISFANDGGMQVVAHYLNVTAQLHGGKSEGVINTKDGSLTRDYERGDPTNIRPQPWQCDTSLGGWFFLNDPIADPQSRSKNTLTVIHLLADVVSKNGNLLMNFPKRGDGSFYPECEAVLTGLAQWMPINGEAIFGSRPWIVFGEGPTNLSVPKYMNELKQPLTAQDVRYTTKDGALYAICLGVPTGPTLLTSQGRLGDGVRGVTLLGSSEKLNYSQAWEGLTIQPPSKWPCDHAVAFKILLG